MVKEEKVGTWRYAAGKEWDLDVPSVRALEISVATVSQLPQSNTSVIAARRDNAALPTWQLLACPPFCQRLLLLGELDQLC